MYQDVSKEAYFKNHQHVEILDVSFKPLKKVLKKLIFHTFWLDMCKFMRIRIQLKNLYADSDADPDFNLMWMLIRMWTHFTIMMLILADPYPDPQLCCIQDNQSKV
jgi:phosphopantetheine adenylyltransferase